MATAAEFFKKGGNGFETGGDEHERAFSCSFDYMVEAGKHITSTCWSCTQTEHWKRWSQRPSPAPKYGYVKSHAQNVMEMDA
jgi:hypothetical protein